MSPIKVAAVVATSNRFTLFSQRSLPSILTQLLPPDYLVVVDDSSQDIQRENQDFVDTLSISGGDVTYLTNGRSRGASGSWNTALDLLLSKAEQPEQLFVAILDDDDAWSPEYLRHCVERVRADGLDMIAADIKRISSDSVDADIQAAPERLRANEFLVGNPGIQGSNLFIRLKTLLQAGGFDEALPSTTDRDLCIRLADLGTVKYARLPYPLVCHYAELDRLRLSSPGSTRKLQGLSSFWFKYQSRMSTRQRTAFTHRASTLFDWKAPETTCADELCGRELNSRLAAVVGMAVSRLGLDEMDSVTDALCHHAQNRKLVGLDVVWVTLDSAASERAYELAKRLRNAGISCFLHEYSENDDGFTYGETLNACCQRVAVERPGVKIRLLPSAIVVDPLAPQTCMEAWLAHHGARTISIDHSVKLADNNAAKMRIEASLRQSRVDSACHRVNHHFGHSDLGVLGEGSEAVVLTDGKTVYKCIDYWKTRLPQSQLAFLRGQVGRWQGKRGLYAIEALVEDGPWVILTYPFEPSKPYRGGYEQAIVQLLDGCAEAGIVCNNVHPKNLIINADNEVKLIDYGSDIRPWSVLGFEHMARRAFLTLHCAERPDLKQLMRSCLTDLSIPEMRGYQRFKAQFSATTWCGSVQSLNSSVTETAPQKGSYSLCVGVIVSKADTVLPLLRTLVPLKRQPAIRAVSVLILANGCGSNDQGIVESFADASNLSLTFIDEQKQRWDAKAGRFGTVYCHRPEGQVGIAQARTMIQRYLGDRMMAEPGTIGCLLDEDMRLEPRAYDCLSWLPSFKEKGVDVLFGAYEGSSPNPPLHGLRGQLLDLWHNLLWLNQLPEHALLPDRRAENRWLRQRFPDYYYDLSRKHTGHLETPFWVEPAYVGETVKEALARLLALADACVYGAPLTRPLVVEVPEQPLLTAKPSVNRGGCTFVFNAQSLTLTPNLTLRLFGEEARRSDMIWAMLNRQMGGMRLEAVNFPVFHESQAQQVEGLNLSKVRAEIVGAALYGALGDFLNITPDHNLRFKDAEIHELVERLQQHLQTRILRLSQSVFRIEGLKKALQRLPEDQQPKVLLQYLDKHISGATMVRLRDELQTIDFEQVSAFLSNLRAQAEDYAKGKDV